MRLFWVHVVERVVESRFHIARIHGSLVRYLQASNDEGIRQNVRVQKPLSRAREPASASGPESDRNARPRLTVAESDADHRRMPQPGIDQIELRRSSKALNSTKGIASGRTQAFVGHSRSGTTGQPKKHEGVPLDQFIYGAEGCVSQVSRRLPARYLSFAQTVPIAGLGILGMWPEPVQQYGCRHRAIFRPTSGSVERVRIV